MEDFEKYEWLKNLIETLNYKINKLSDDNETKDQKIRILEEEKDILQKIDAPSDNVNNRPRSRS